MLLLVISIQFVNYSTQFSFVRQVTELLKQLFHLSMIKRIGQGFFKTMTPSKNELHKDWDDNDGHNSYDHNGDTCLLYTSPS
ncbi:hypothetical protein ACQ4LK_20450, partial [Bacillus pumilus]